MTEADVRSMFKTYREVTARHVHDDYLWAPCYVDGTIALKGRKSYRFRIRPGNTIETDFPDGKSVILGGAKTDSASGH